MLSLSPKLLTQKAFEPYGDVVDVIMLISSLILILA